MKRFNTILLLLPLFLLSCGLEEHEPYNTPFIHIMKDEVSTTVVTSNSNFVATYNVYLSSAPLTRNLDVTYEIKVGNGLVAGRDYEMVTNGNMLTFMPGIYDMPIRVRWLPNKVDPVKDNTMKIILVSNSMNITMGMPGPDQLQKEFTITKTN
jgi:hypothetical protein